MTEQPPYECEICRNTLTCDRCNGDGCFISPRDNWSYICEKCSGEGEIICPFCAGEEE